MPKSQKILTFLKESIKQGFLLHGSPANLDIIIPKQATCLSRVAGNLRAVYATNNPQAAVCHAATCTHNTQKETFLYLCPADPFTNISGHQFVCMTPIIPTNRLTMTLADAREFLLKNSAHNNTPPVNTYQKFFQKAAKKYFTYATAFHLQSETHGERHATSVASIGHILAQKECPKFYKEVVIGCFLHDIGRTSDTEGRNHAFTGAAIALRILRKDWKKLHLPVILRGIGYHTCGLTSQEKSIGCIWDADRLTMPRLWQSIDIAKLSTQQAKKEALFLNAILKNQIKKHPTLTQT